jgi:hypothetical protein
LGVATQTRKETIMRDITVRLLFILTFCLFGIGVQAQRNSAIIVKQVSLENQTAFIKPTKLVTPNSDALYRISAYMEVTTVGTNGEEYYLNIGWTDAVGKKDKTVIDIANSNGEIRPLWEQTTLVVHDLAGSPLGYSVTDILGGMPQVPFSVFITVEQLQ